MTAPASGAAATKNAAANKALTENQLVEGGEAHTNVVVGTGEAGAAPAPFLIRNPSGKTVEWLSQNPGKNPPAPYQAWDWANVPMNIALGAAAKPIKDVGCGLTSVAMVMRYFGYDITPKSLNAWAQQEHCFQSSNNGIQDWDKLVKAGGSMLRYHRGDELTPAATKSPVARKPLWDYARARARQNLPSIARVNYAGKNMQSGKYEPWGDHFVVIVGIHPNGRDLIINDPGRFNRPEFQKGNGVGFPNDRDNWLAENPKRGTTWNGGYTLIRIDTIDGPYADQPSIPTVALTEDNWKPYAKQEIVKHTNSFILDLLRRAREFLVEDIRRQANGAPYVEYPFNAATLDLLAESADEMLKEAHRAFGQKVVDVLEQVGNAGLTGDFGIEMIDLFKKHMPPPPPNIVQGIVQVGTQVIPAGKRLLQFSAGELESLFPQIKFAEHLAKAQQMLAASTDAFTFRIRLIDAAPYNFAIDLNAKLTQSLGDDGAKWATIKSECQAAFWFPSLEQVAQVILSKVFTALGLLKDQGIRAALDGLLDPTDATRFAETLSGRAQFTIDEQATTLAPRDLGPLSFGTGTKATGKFVVDFYGPADAHAELRIDAKLDSKLSIGPTQQDVSLTALGHLRHGLSFEPLFKQPLQVWGTLKDKFLSTLQGDVDVTIKAANGTTNASIDDEFFLKGTQNAKLVLKYKSGGAKIDFSGALGGAVKHGEESLKLDLKSRATMLIDIDSPPTFAMFWKSPEEHFQTILDQVVPKLAADGFIEVKASSERATVGPFTLRPNAKLKINFNSDGHVQLSTDGECHGTVSYEGHNLEFDLKGTAGAAFDIPDPPPLRTFIKSPKQSFAKVMTQLFESLEGEATFKVRLDHDYDEKLLSFRSNTTFDVQIKPPSAIFKVEGGLGLSRIVTDSGKAITLALKGESTLTFSLEQLDLRKFFDDSNHSFAKLFTELPRRLRGELHLQTSQDSAIPIGDSAVLTSTSGLELTFKHIPATSEKFDVTIGFHGQGTLALTNYPQCFVRLGADLDASASAWSTTLSDRQLTPIWDRPRDLPVLIQQSLQSFRGHARVVFDVSGALDESMALPGEVDDLLNAQFPFDDLKSQLTEWGVTKIRGGGKVIANYWQRESGGSLTVQYKFYGTVIASKLPIPSSAVLTMRGEGITRIDRDARALNLDAFRASPTDELRRLGTDIMTTFASSTKLEVLFGGVLFGARVEEFIAAIEHFRAHRFTDALVALNDTGYVQLSTAAAPQPVTSEDVLSDLFWNWLTS